MRQRLQGTDLIRAVPSAAPFCSLSLGSSTDSLDTANLSRRRITKSEKSISSEDPNNPLQTKTDDQQETPGPEERILISEVQIKGVTGELEQVAKDAIALQPNFAYTLEEVQDNVVRVFDTGYFATCQPIAEDTRDGVRVILKVTANPELRRLVVTGANALPQRVVEDEFQEQYSKTLNYKSFKRALERLNSWYEERGIFGQVVDADLSEAGECQLKVQEAVVSKVTLRVLDRESGDPIKGQTKPHVIMRQLSTRPGQVYNLRQARRDIDAVYSMGILEDVNMLPQVMGVGVPGDRWQPCEGAEGGGWWRSGWGRWQPCEGAGAEKGRGAGDAGSPVRMLGAGGGARGVNAWGGVTGQDPDAGKPVRMFGAGGRGLMQLVVSPEDPGMVDLTLNVVERKTGGFSAGGGLSARGLVEGALAGFVGSCAYTQRNLFGLNHKLSASAELGQVDSLFRVNHTDPWVWGDKYRTSRSISMQNTRSSGNAVHGKAIDEGAQDGTSASTSDGGVVIHRLMGGVEYSRPLSVTGWNGTMGMTWQRAGVKDDHSRPLLVDAYGSPLTFSGTLSDLSFVSLLRLVYNPTKTDSQLVLSTEQALPLKPDWLNFNRMQVRADRTIRLGPARLSLLGKGGAIIGDLPPYEAFPIGANWPAPFP
ncbi:Outer envelope protein 80, chloroplastic [Cymbomonas tetramitiformis]|uniref:Outer envelope protein 80, chloroplastic n=1 Tax=Cymbomonas tetramitiformis TaxID=36881 RepID=A0AAE0GMW2_9CHLO|nr:Outer envelope protein 80, chloroplastic [Cymbomonas tetramitiformis]